MQNNKSLTAEQVNCIAQKALKEVDGCVYLILTHGVDNRREYAVRCAEMPLTYILLESNSILSDGNYYEMDTKTQRLVKRFLAYKDINYDFGLSKRQNLWQRMFCSKRR